MTEDLPERFIAKFSVDEFGCWSWIGAQSPSKKGRWPYGIFSVGGILVMAHRFSYEMTKGKIPAGLVLDHLCRNTLCVNPDHLEPVTIKENINRGVRYCSTLTHCPQGHPYDGENLYRDPDGDRHCRICRKEKNKQWCSENRPPRGRNRQSVIYEGREIALVDLASEKSLNIKILRDRLRNGYSLEDALKPKGQFDWHARRNKS